jgi:hypothetical protein
MVPFVPLPERVEERFIVAAQASQRRGSGVYS